MPKRILHHSEVHKCLLDGTILFKSDDVSQTTWDSECKIIYLINSADEILHCMYLVEKWESCYWCKLLKYPGFDNTRVINYTRILDHVVYSKA